MNRKLSGKTRVIIVLTGIFVFLAAALSASIVMFVKADRAASQADRLERVVRETDSLGEVLKASNSNTQTALHLLTEHRGAESSDDSITLYYTGSFEPSSKNDCKYRVSIVLTAGKDGSFDTWQICWFTKAGKKAFYNLTFKSVAQ